MSSTMFHQGDLQSGIASAIQQQKLVACFIYKPDEETSRRWEEEFLTANTCSGNVCGQLGSLLGEKAVLLRIEFGSQEAGFLGAFCPVEQAPMMVVIRDGKVLESIVGEVEKDVFVDRLGHAVGLNHGEEGKEAGETESGAAGQSDVPESDPLMSSGAQQSPGAPTQSPAETQTAQPSQAHTLLAERARRLENERIRREAEEKAARLARQKARQEEEAASARQTATSERNEQQKARDAWLYQQKQRKDEAKKEKARILAQIESDKQERKAAALRRKEDSGGGGEFSEALAASGSNAVATGAKSGSCALQIRLFDGSSIKAKFAADADLATAVRTWVDEASPAGGADIPYSFRQILAPQPSRSIEVGEEGQSLQDLGLTPSATLVLVPVAGAVDAYAGRTSSIGAMASWLGGTGYRFASGLLGAVPFLGGGNDTNTASSGSEGPYMAGTGDPQDLSNARGADMADADGGQTGTKIRVKTLADQRAEQAKKGAGEGTEFYNGNSSAFQGDGDAK